MLFTLVLIYFTTSPAFQSPASQYLEGFDNFNLCDMAGTAIEQRVNPAKDIHVIATCVRVK
jgi:hypothetical protein